ncbi:MAG: hypothetical protein M0Q94_13940 [Candidatus Cloacimonetes bacterium]|nr:hypothetical protein [Candidatus Cloacimonadota bacterium]
MTTAERTNSEMKECFVPAKLYFLVKNALLILLTLIKRMDMVQKEVQTARHALQIQQLQRD